jgi:hypothetical protein
VEDEGADEEEGKEGRGIRSELVWGRKPKREKRTEKSGARVATKGAVGYGSKDKEWERREDRPK